MRLVVIGAGDDVDMAVPGGEGTNPSWPLGRASFLEVGESLPLPGLVVEVEHGPSAMAKRALVRVRGSLLPPGRVVEVERGPSAKGWRAPSLGWRWQPGRMVEDERGLPARDGVAPWAAGGGQSRSQMSMGPPSVRREPLT